MKSKISEKISSETSEEDKENVRKYANNIINKLEMKYYLINNNIMKASSEMPDKNDSIYNERYDMWLRTLKKCEITDFDLSEIRFHLNHYITNPIEVTDIIAAHQADGLFEVISFKPKQVDNDDNFVYSINTKELIAELDKWIEQCDIKINEFAEVGMENSMLSSMAMKLAYSNVKKFILEKNK